MHTDLIALRTQITNNVAARAAAWDAYNTAAAPILAKIDALIAEYGVRRVPAKLFDPLEAQRNALARARCDVIDALEAEAQATFGFTEWHGMKDGQPPRGWRA